MGTARFRELREAEETVEEEIHLIVTKGYQQKIREVEQWIYEDDKRELMIEQSEKIQDRGLGPVDYPEKV